MSSLIDEQLQLAFEAINAENCELAQDVIRLDEKVDLWDLKIDKACLKIFALYQPVAIDLRLLISALTINRNLERIGDIIVNLCENFLLSGKKPVFYDSIKFAEMANIVSEMLRTAIDSFIQMDATLAEEVIKSDRILDKLNVENHTLIIRIMKEEGIYIEEAVSYLVMCRLLERIGDHTTNIAEDIFFIVEGKTIKHNYEKFFSDFGSFEASDLDNDDDQ
jgi:phosphate transport system protein